MTRRRRHARLSPASGAAGGDTDALQTDVMRFMSIIGLCLMAVFALVQGIPVEEQGKRVPLSQSVQAASIREEISSQQQQLRELQDDLQRLQAEKESTHQVLTVTQQHLEQLAGQTQQLGEARTRLATQLENLEQQLEQGRKALANIEQAKQLQVQDLAELSGQLLDTQQQLDYSRKEIKALQQRVRQQTARPVPRQHSTPAPAATPVPEGQGFVLRFASAAALDRLVAAGSVRLYGMADQRAWQLSLKAGRPVVAPVTFPAWFHEMSAATVPAHYLHSMEKMSANPGESGVVWGVQLPAATRTAITALTRERQGGALVIGDIGQVTLEE
jgi:hypothetical protein